MFIYLSKKIAIPNNIRLHSLAWNPEQGWIACGGEQGLIKVLKLETVGGGPSNNNNNAGNNNNNNSHYNQFHNNNNNNNNSNSNSNTNSNNNNNMNKKKSANRGLAAPSNLSMNQTLEGHKDSVCCVTWNANFRKLTTSDENGLIIVWSLHKGVWYEEMVNNRNKSVVKDMKWTSDGSKICIVYEDGAVIVGSVEGTRLWGKDLQWGLKLVEWSPNAKNIIFVTAKNELQLFDSQGIRIRSIKLHIGDNSSRNEIVGIHWYDGAEGYGDSYAPTFAVALANGKVQITRGEIDDRPVIINSNMKLCQCKWNSSGNILALAGTQTIRTASGDEQEFITVAFYDAFGNLIRVLKVPGKSGISALSWEGSGLRVALAVDAYIFFANIRNLYPWAHISNTLIYAITKPEKHDMTCVFWDLQTDTRYTKQVKNLCYIRAMGDRVLLVQCDSLKRTTTLMLCNSIGSCIDLKDLRIYPRFVEMTETHIFLADERTIYMWQYKTVGGKILEQQGGKMASGRERVFDIDDNSTAPAQMLEGYRPRKDQPDDPICCITCSDKMLIIGRDSGRLQRYSLPHLGAESKYRLRNAPLKMKINNDGTKLGIIENTGSSMFTIMELASPLTEEESYGEKQSDEPVMLPIERKDTWDFMWADDNPNMISLMEKTRLYIFDLAKGPVKKDPTDEGPGEYQPDGGPVQCAGYLASFKDLVVKVAMLDEIIASDPGIQDKDSAIAEIECKILEETRDLISHASLDEAYRYADKYSHPKLWKVIAESALESLNLSVADKAFVKCQDYQGIQYVKKIKWLSDRMKQRAEVSVYFNRFDEAESTYREIDRKDLAIDLRERIGDWFRVVHLVQNGGGDDQILVSAYNKIGDFYSDRFQWAKAVQYYSNAKNLEKMSDCYYKLDNYSSLKNLINLAPQGSPFLFSLASKFETLGLSGDAVDCYIKAGEPKRALDCCVLLNDWTKAVELAEEYNFPQIESLVSKVVTKHLDRGDKLKAIEIYRKANKATEAAKLLADMAEEVIEKNANPVRAKKLLVLAALEVERFKKQAFDMTLTGGTGNIAQTTAQTLDNLMTVDREAGKSRVLDNAWRGASAYHYYMLAHRQLYENDIDKAMKTSIRVAEFEDIINPRDVYSLIALTAFHNRFFGICSRAFIKLETLPIKGEDDEDFADKIQSLAVKIFTRFQPHDPSALPREYIACLETGTAYHACVVTGRAIGSSMTWTCKVCKHHAVENDIRGINNCPLCHNPAL